MQFHKVLGYVLGKECPRELSVSWFCLPKQIGKSEKFSIQLVFSQIHHFRVLPPSPNNCIKDMFCIFSAHQFVHRNAKKVATAKCLINIIFFLRNFPFTLSRCFRIIIISAEKFQLFLGHDSLHNILLSVRIYPLVFLFRKESL